MAIFLGIVPILAVLSALFMYRFTGRRQILKLDLVQFMYAFVVSPVLFIWAKSFLFFLMRHELDLRLSVSELFVLDSIFSALFLYIFAFVVIHSLTKTFDLKREHDPLYDIFAHSEYFHMELSHLAIYLGGMVVVTFISLVNVWIPLTIMASKTTFYGLLIAGIIGGIAGFAGIWSYESNHIHFRRLMKLLLGIFFLIHAVTYLIIEPDFSIFYLAYWFVFMVFATAVVLGLFAEKPDEDSRFQNWPFTINWRKPKFYAKSMRNLTKKLITRSNKG